MRRAWPLLMIASVVAVYAAAIAWTGGFDLEIASTRIRSHAWERPAILATTAFLLFLIVERHRMHGPLVVAWTTLDSGAAARLIVCIALGWTLLAGARFGSPVAGGSDSYGYLSQAHQLSDGRLSEEILSNPAFTWTNVQWSLTPLGHVGAPQPGRISATYPPGLPLLMAAVVPLGDRAAYLLVPLFGALLVFCTWRAGSLLGDSLAGAMAALIVSLTPTFLLQLIQPMSDIPAAACWAGAVVAAAAGKGRRRALLAGSFTGLAVMIRPNLAPLAAIVLVLILTEGAARIQRVTVFLLPVIIAASALLMIQSVRFGSPFGSGYGDPGQLFGVENIRLNLRLYPHWITSSQTPLIWLFLAAPFTLTRTRTRPFFWAVAALIAATWCAYLPYVSFRESEWFYTRFLLPAIPFMWLFAWMVILAAVRLAPVSARAVLAGIVVAVTSLVLARGSSPILRNTAPHEQRYVAAGRFVRDSLPPNAIILAVQHSGSVRYYSNKPTLRWDIASPGELDTIVDALRRAGFSPYLVVDADEVSQFRDHFPGQRSAAALRPLAEFGVTHVYSID